VQQKLLDHLVRAGEHGRRQVEAERLGRLGVNHQFVFDWRLQFGPLSGRHERAQLAFVALK
jgi:hypothetical protein